jgi:hypothetical protein
VFTRQGDVVTGDIVAENKQGEEGLRSISGLDDSMLRRGEHCGYVGGTLCNIVEDGEEPKASPG